MTKMNKRKKGGVMYKSIDVKDKEGNIKDVKEKFDGITWCHEKFKTTDLVDGCWQ